MSAGRPTEYWRSIYQPPWDEADGEPWNRPLGTPVPDDADPRELPGTTVFYAYTVEENDLHFTIFVDDVWSPRLFVAEEPGAIHVVVVDEPNRPPEDGVEQGRALIDLGPRELHGMLERPLGGRPIIDATRDVAAKRLAHQPADSYELRWMAPGDHRPDGPGLPRRRPLRRRKPRT